MKHRAGVFWPARGQYDRPHGTAAPASTRRCCRSTGNCPRGLSHSPGQQEVSLIMSNGVPPVTQPVADFFAREPANEIEAAMLAACRGTVLDIAAGAGRSTLLLQHRGLDVLALDISRGAAAVMAARGVKRVQCVDWVAFCETSEEMFDTILMLGRGISLFGSPDRIGRLLSVVARLVGPAGRSSPMVGNPQRRGASSAQDPPHGGFPEPAAWRPPVSPT